MYGNKWAKINDTVQIICLKAKQQKALNDTISNNKWKCKINDNYQIISTNNSSVVTAAKTIKSFYKGLSSWESQLRIKNLRSGLLPTAAFFVSSNPVNKKRNWILQPTSYHFSEHLYGWWSVSSSYPFQEKRWIGAHHNWYTALDMKTPKDLCSVKYFKMWEYCNISNLKRSYGHICLYYKFVG